MYVATVNGAPAKPMSGVRPSSRARASRIAAGTNASASRTSSVRSERTASGPSMRDLNFGPGSNSTSAPMACARSRMSLKRIAASKP